MQADATSTAASSHRRDAMLIAIVLFAIVLRAGAIAAIPKSLQADPDGYRFLAVNLVKFGTFGRGDLPTAYRPPLYPIMLIGCVAVHDWQRLAIGMLHVALGAATVFLTFRLAVQWGLRRRHAVIAALLVACDPILISQSAQVMTETAAAFFAVAGLAMLTAAQRQRTAQSMFLAGVVLGLGSLCRPSFLPWAALAGVLFLWQAWRLKKNNTTGGRPAIWTVPVSFFLGLLLTLAPWTIRNQLDFGRPIVMTTHGGYTLLLGNNPSFYEWLRTGAWGTVWSADGLDPWLRRSPHTEIQADQAAYATAFKTIENQPGTFAYACAVRLGRFWSLLPHQISPTESPRGRLARWLVAAWYAVEFLLAIWGLGGFWGMRGEGRGARDEGRLAAASTRRAPGEIMQPASTPAIASPWLFGFLLIAALMASHTFYWTDMRMRAPAMPVVALLAAAGLANGRRQNLSET